MGGHLRPQYPRNRLTCPKGKAEFQVPAIVEVMQEQVLTMVYPKHHERQIHGQAQISPSACPT
jgi:hypothetical protein